MPYVIYNIQSTILYMHPRTRKTEYATEKAARGAMTKALRYGWIHEGNYAIAESGEFYAHIERMKTVKNLMSGKEVRIPVNTPRSCDPSSELYWTM